MQFIKISHPPIHSLIFREKVIRVFPGNANELEFLNSLQDNQDLEVSEANVCTGFWSPGMQLGLNTSLYRLHCMRYISLPGAKVYNV